MFLIPLEPDVRSTWERLQRKDCKQKNKRKLFVVAQWYDPVTFQPKQSGGVGSMPSKALPLERHDKGLWTD